MPCLNQHDIPVKDIPLPRHPISHAIKASLSDILRPSDKPIPVIAKSLGVIPLLEIKQGLIAIVHALIQAEIRLRCEGSHGLLIGFSGFSRSSHKRQNAHPHSISRAQIGIYTPPKISLFWLQKIFRIKADTVGFEPTTSWLTAMRSARLNYVPEYKKSDMMH